MCNSTVANTVEQIKGFRYQKWRTKQMILAIDPSQKKKKGASWFQLDDELDDAWIEDHQEFLVEQERTKITKKFEKENEKLKENKEKPMPEKMLKERLQVVKEMEAKYKKENKTGKVEPEGKGPTVDKYMKAIEKLDERARVLETQAEDRDGNKEVALGTSKIVINPRPYLVSRQAQLTWSTELHRSTLDGRLRQEVRRPDREVLLQDPPGQVPMGHQIGRGHGRLDLLIPQV